METSTPLRGGGLASYKAQPSAAAQSLQQTDRGTVNSLKDKDSSSPIMSNRRLLQRIRNPPQPSTPTLVASKLILCVMPIVKIVIGAVYFNDCPRQHYIPIYLIVLGVFSLVLVLFSWLPCAQEPEDGATPNPLSRVCLGWNTLIGIFLFAWFIAGNVWIYSIYKPNYNKDTTNMDPYCDKTLYLFAFWTTTLVYILMGVSLVCGLIARVIRRLRGQADPIAEV